MAPALYVLLHPEVAHLATIVQEIGAVPVIDLTSHFSENIPPNAWIRVHPNSPTPGHAGVILTGPADPIPNRDTWVEVLEAQPIPPGFSGILLKGREAGGNFGKEDGLQMLSQCPDPASVILNAGLGPHTAASAAALSGSLEPRTS